MSVSTSQKCPQDCSEGKMMKNLVASGFNSIIIALLFIAFLDVIDGFGLFIFLLFMGLLIEISLNMLARLQLGRQRRTTKRMKRSEMAESRPMISLVDIISLTISIGIIFFILRSLIIVTFVVVFIMVFFFGFLIRVLFGLFF